MAQEEPRTASDGRRTDSSENSETETGPSSMNIEIRDPDDLMPHPINEKIYGDEAPEWFVESIKQNGIRTPVEIIPGSSSHFVDDDTEIIVSGHRRVDAASKLGLDEIPVIILDSYESKFDERHAIVESNKQRDKTFSQKMRESELLVRNEREKAKQRIKKGGRKGGSKGTQNFVDPSNTGEVREKVAETIGWSKEKLRYSQKLWEAADGGDEVPEQLQQVAEEEIDKVDDGDNSPYGAYQKVKRLEDQLDLGSEVTWDEVEAAVKQAGQMSFPPMYAESIFERAEPDLDETDSLWSLVATVEQERQSDGDSPGYHGQGLLALFLYRLEQDGYVALTEQAPKKPDPLTTQKPHAETLRTMYWEDELPVGQMGLILGVHEYVVYQWMREENISVRMGSFSEEIQQVIGKHRSDPDS